MKKILLIGLILAVIIMAACSNNTGMQRQMGNMQRSTAPDKISTINIAKSEEPNATFDKEFEKLCKDRTPDNWESMRPMVNGEFTSEVSCWGCMSDDGMTHFCDKEEYRGYLENEK